MGSKVYVEGPLRTREWEKNGIKLYTTEIIASELQLLDGRPDDLQGQSGYGGQQPQQAPRQQQSGGYGQPQSFGSWGNAPQQPNGYAAQSEGTQSRGPAPQQPAPNFDDFNDDIPF